MSLGLVTIAKLVIKDMNKSPTKLVCENCWKGSHIMPTLKMQFPWDLFQPVHWHTWQIVQTVHYCCCHLWWNHSSQTLARTNMLVCNLHFNWYPATWCVAPDRQKIGLLQKTFADNLQGRNPSKGTIIDSTAEQSQKAKGWLCVQVDATSKLRSVTSSEVFNSHIAYSVSGL